MKIIAFYLPQFHEIPENNKWWGEGFTDWINVRKAKPLIKNQYQPREPLNDNYYDLSNVNIMKWQSKIALEHGIYGFCYYHYWFNGKLLLEKPLENMLKDKEVEISFCLSWANEPWARTWDGQETDILISQSYGGKKEWEDHFEYLLKYFKDKRYITENNKPMMVIYKTMHIPLVEEMCEYWNELAKNNGFDGIYFVETIGGIQKKPFLNISEALIEFEPNYTIAGHDLNIFEKYLFALKRKFKKGLAIFDYDKIWGKILKRNLNRFQKRIYVGGYVDWDNTPRKGFKGVVFKGSTPEKFEKYIKNQIDRIDQNGYIFINAWNEWAEGAYLEPDKKYGFKYLEAIKKALNQ
jgi:hypothetical protein